MKVSLLLEKKLYLIQSSTSAVFFSKKNPSHNFFGCEWFAKLTRVDYQPLMTKSQNLPEFLCVIETKYCSSVPLRQEPKTNHLSD